MRLKGRQARFLLVVMLGWVGARAYWLWPERRFGETGHAASVAAQIPFSGSVQIVPTAVRVEPVEAPAFLAAPAEKKSTGLRQAQDERKLEVRGALEKANPVAPPKLLITPDVLPHLTLTTGRAQSSRRFEAEAYLFYRPGGGQPALGQGELGGSQVAARIAWRLTPAIGLAGRFYAPLGGKGKEVAVGVDYHPVPTAAFRISIERRQRLDAAGRRAWSAYAAGGFYRGGRPGGVEADGYGQAGFVGLQRRDGFVDGALRIGYRLPVERMAAVFGAGAWGAEQPGVARVDVGPRIALRLPVDAHMLSLALDGRLRVAGRARPGSGAAFTLAADF